MVVNLAAKGRVTGTIAGAIKISFLMSGRSGGANLAQKEDATHPPFKKEIKKLIKK